MGQLASWLRETARSGGLISAPFCFGLEDAAARDWQSAAVEKRCVFPYLLLLCATKVQMELWRILSEHLVGISVAVTCFECQACCPAGTGPALHGCARSRMTVPPSCWRTLGRAGAACVCAPSQTCSCPPTVAEQRSWPPGDACLEHNISHQLRSYSSFSCILAPQPSTCRHYLRSSHLPAFCNLPLSPAHDQNHHRHY